MSDSTSSTTVNSISEAFSSTTNSISNSFSSVFSGSVDDSSQSENDYSGSDYSGSDNSDSIGNVDDFLLGLSLMFFIILVSGIVVVIIFCSYLCLCFGKKNPPLQYEDIVNNFGSNMPESNQ